MVYPIRLLLYRSCDVLSFVRLPSHLDTPILGFENRGESRDPDSTPVRNLKTPKSLNFKESFILGGLLNEYIYKGVKSPFTSFIQYIFCFFSGRLDHHDSQA